MVDGVIYLATPYSRIVALDFANRRELWSFDVPNRDQPSTRGVEYYKGDGSSPPAILFGTRSGKLYSLNAATGQPTPASGRTASST